MRNRCFGILKHLLSLLFINGFTQVYISGLIDNVYEYLYIYSKYIADEKEIKSHGDY
ncbi:MAG: hypothetical protein GX389_08205 [Clostridiaceae bacterium]|nr:hypothetical protein [Clostridiaceae bacterium]